MTASIYQDLKRVVLAQGSTTSRQIGYLSRFMKNRFLNSVFIQSMGIYLGLFFSQPQTYIRIILRAVKGYTSCTTAQFHSVKKRVTENLVCPSSSFSLRSCCVLYTLGFYDQATSWSSSCDELKNITVNILLKLVIKSSTGIRAIG